MPICEGSELKAKELERLAASIEEMYVDDEPGAERELDEAAEHLRRAVAILMGGK